MTENLVTLLSDLKEQDALRVAKDRLNVGEEPLKIFEDDENRSNNRP